MKIVITNTDTCLHGFNLFTIEGGKSIWFPADMINDGIIPKMSTIELDLPVAEDATVKFFADAPDVVSYRIAT